MQAYAIGDIRSYIGSLQCRIEGCMAPARTDTMYFPVEYVSKGPDPGGVLAYLPALRSDGYSIKCRPDKDAGRLAN